MVSIIGIKFFLELYVISCDIDILESGIFLVVFFFKGKYMICIDNLIIIWFDWLKIYISWGERKLLEIELVVIGLIKYFCRFMKEESSDISVI